MPTLLEIELSAGREMKISFNDKKFRLIGQETQELIALENSCISFD